MGCPCNKANASAKLALDKGSVDGTLAVLTQILPPPTAPTTGQQTKVVDTTDYSTGVFVKTGKKI